MALPSEPPSALPAQLDCPVLDLRPRGAYLARRLRGSANLQLHELNGAMFLLPDKASPLGLVLPNGLQHRAAPADAAGGDDAAAAGDGAAGEAHPQSATDVPAFLRDRGWTRLSFAVTDVPELWSRAGELGLLDPTPGTDEVSLSRRWLFRPSVVLERSIEQVEDLIASSSRCGRHKSADRDGCGTGYDGQDEGAPAGSSGRGASSGSSAQGASPPAVLAKCLDVGCGSGRDLAWLATRTGRMLPLIWHVTGLDNWAGALERARGLLQRARVPPAQGCFALASINDKTGNIEVLPAGAKRGRAGKGSDGAAPTKPAQGAAVDIGATDTHHHQQQQQQQQHQSDAEEASSYTYPYLDQPPQPASYDLVLCVRFMSRAFFGRAAALLRPGGFFLCSTFLDGPGVRAFGRPSGPEHLLQPGELASTWFGPAAGFDVLRDELVLSEDGRELSCFVARRRLADS